MANYDSLRNAIISVIHENGNNEITGPILQQTLLTIISYLGAGFQYYGKAAPATDPGTPDPKVFYIAGPGTYVNFNNASVDDGEIGLFSYNGTWTIEKVKVGKNYDGYLGITYGSPITATGTQNASITTGGDFSPNANFTTKAFPVTGGKSYYITGLEANNPYTCGWAAYDGATKLSYGAHNIEGNTAVARVPDDANILYVCQPNYGNLPAITVRPTESVIDELFDEINNPKVVTDISDLDIANYALLVRETYVNKIWNNGVLIDDAYHERNSTSLVPIDTSKMIVPGTNGYAEVLFFGESENYISKLNSYIHLPVEPSQIPADAKFVAFNYYRGSLVADDGNFYVSTRPYYKRLTEKLYATQNKRKGTRPKVYIYTTDTQETIFKKMVDAIYIEDCDVIFENGAYSFDSIFYLLRSKYQWADAFELPIGGNCHYYFNNATLTGSYGNNSPSANLLVESNSSILGTHRLDGQTFELHDGELIANGLVYCVHDEASGLPECYVHKYENMVLRYNTGTYTQSLSKCIGGGTGLAGSVIVNNCKFYNAHTTPDISWHGHNYETASVFKLFVSSCFFANGIGLHQLATNEMGYLFLSASLIQTVPTSWGNWTVFSAI